MTLRVKYSPEDELRDSLEPLVSLGCDRLQLTAFAWVLGAITPELERQQIDNLRQQVDAIEKRLKRISMAADDLAIINAQPGLGLNRIRAACVLDSMNALCPAPSSDQEKVSELIRTLECQPDLLRGYVAHVRQRIKTIKKALHFRGSGPYRNAVKFALLQYVEKCTGSPHYELVSMYLEAFRYAHGGADDVEEKEFTPEALQQFNCRQRHRTRTAGPDEKSSISSEIASAPAMRN